MGEYFDLALSNAGVAVAYFVFTFLLPLAGVFFYLIGTALYMTDRPGNHKPGIPAVLWFVMVLLVTIGFWRSDTHAEFRQWANTKFSRTIESERAARAADHKRTEAVRINEKTEVRQYILVSWNPPKHFYVTLKDVVTGQVYESVYVSKHCNAVGQLRRSDLYSLRVTSYFWSNTPDTPRITFHNLYEAFC